MSTNEMKTLLLELKLTGQMRLTNIISDTFLEAMNRKYIERKQLDKCATKHTQDWEWTVSEKGLKYLEQS